MAVLETQSRSPLRLSLWISSALILACVLVALFAPQLMPRAPSDFASGLGLIEVVSPLRMRSVGAILARVKRQLMERAAA